MNKKIVALALATVFALSTVSLSFAARVNCTVDSVEGDTVTMTCKKADQLKEGEDVRVTTKTKKVAIEGC